MTDYLRSPVFQLRCLELLLGIISSAFIVATALPVLWSIFLTDLAHLTLYGYILLNLLVLIGFVIREPISRALMLLISASATILNLVTGVILISGYSEQGLVRLLISGIVTFLNAIVCGGDVYYIIRYFQE